MKQIKNNKKNNMDNSHNYQLNNFKKIRLIDNQSNNENHMIKNLDLYQYKPIKENESKSPILKNKFRHDRERSPFKDVAEENGRESPFDKNGYLK